MGWVEAGERPLSSTGCRTLLIFTTIFALYSPDVEDDRSFRHTLPTIAPAVSCWYISAWLFAGPWASVIFGPWVPLVGFFFDLGVGHLVYD